MISPSTGSGTAHLYIIVTVCTMAVVISLATVRQAPD